MVAGSNLSWQFGDLISHQIFKLYSTNLRLFQGNSDSVQYVQLILVFVLNKLNFKISGITF